MFWRISGATDTLKEHIQFIRTQLQQITWNLLKNDASTLCAKEFCKIEKLYFFERKMISMHQDFWLNNRVLVTGDLRDLSDGAAKGRVCFRACFSFGHADFHSVYTSTSGNVGAFSFFSHKNLETGEGGILTTDDDTLAEKMRSLRCALSHDRPHRASSPQSCLELRCHRSRLQLPPKWDNIQAWVDQLQKLEKSNQARRALIVLRHRLVAENCPELVLLLVAHPGFSACHPLPVLLPMPMERAAFITGMKSTGIQDRFHYPHLSDFHFYNT
jgi:hypothetical protein